MWKKHNNLHKRDGERKEGRKKEHKNVRTNPRQEASSQQHFISLRHELNQGPAGEDKS
jgi:hypothetical protein